MREEKAIFAGGNFWNMVRPFDELPGVQEVVSGYTCELKESKGDNEVLGDRNDYNTVQVSFDPLTVSYEKLLKVFWKQIDPTDAGGQFNDRGTCYRTAIFYVNEKQRRLAFESMINKLSFRKQLHITFFILPEAHEIQPITAHI